jgi:DNA invertase Pin-like site-specific DNA recombinase
LAQPHLPLTEAAVDVTPVGPSAACHGHVLDQKQPISRFRQERASAVSCNKEKLSGREGVRRPQLEKAIEALGTGDVLVLAEWDRVTRSMLDGIKIIERVAARGATFKALDRKWLDLTTPIGRGILAFLSSLAEDERARILARANGGRAAAKKRGVKFGPKPKLAVHQAREAARMVREEGKSLREVAHHYHVGHSTIVRALGRAEA